jgi:hypothetical protein
MEILMFLFAMAFCIWFGWRMREEIAKHKMQKFIKYAQQMQEDDLPDNYIRVVIEKHNDTFFVYEEENKTFMAQANSKDDLDKSLRERFPGKMFAVKEENLIEVGFLS